MRLNQPPNPATNATKRSVPEWTRDIGPDTIGARRCLHPIVKKSHKPPIFRRGMPEDKAPQLKRLRNPDDAI